MKIELNITGLDALAASIESIARAMTANKPDSVAQKIAAFTALDKMLTEPEPIMTDDSDKIADKIAETGGIPLSEKNAAKVIEKLEEKKDAPKPSKKKKPAPKKEKVVEPEPVVEPIEEPAPPADLVDFEQAKLDLIVLTKGAMSEATKAGEQQDALVPLKAAYKLVGVPNVTKCPLDKVESLAHEITTGLAQWIK